MTAQLCRLWGFDPGSWVDDDVLAMNVRAAFAMAINDEPEPEETEADVARKHNEGIARAHRHGEALRKAMEHGG